VLTVKLRSPIFELLERLVHFDCSLLQLVISRRSLEVLLLVQVQHRDLRFHDSQLVEILGPRYQLNQLFE
jgi:hypothetical protein